MLHAVTSTVTFAEIRRKPFADKNFSLADEIKFTLQFFSSLSVASIDEKLGEATLFLTNDKRIKKVDAVEVLVLSDFLQS